MSFIIPLGAANKKIGSVSSGLVSATLNDAKTEFTYTYTDGSVLKVPVTQPPLDTDLVRSEVDDYLDDNKEDFRGEDGKGVQIIENPDEEIDENTVLVFDESDFSEVDSALSEELTATVDIGTVTFGKKYPAGTSLESIIRDMLIREEAPTVTLTLNPTTTLYDVVADTVSNIVLTATVTKKTYAPKTVKYYVDGTLVETKNINAGGAYSYTHTFSPATNADHTFKVVASDGKLESNASKTIKFVGQTYYGIVASDIGTPSASQIKALSKKLKDVKGYTWEGITTDFGKVVYAYPQSFGALSSIKDPVNNFTYTDSFTRTSATIDGIAYYVYTQTVASASDNVKLVFA